MQRSTTTTINRDELNLKDLNQNQRDALLALSNTTTSFAPNQPCGNNFQLPNDICGAHIDPDHLTQQDRELLRNIYVCSDVKNHNSLKRDHHYISINPKANNRNPNNPRYEATIVCPMKDIAVNIIKPTNLDDTEKSILIFLLLNNYDHLYNDRLYRIRINGTLVLISFTENIIKYPRKNGNGFAYAISNTIHGTGKQGIVYKSTHSLRLSHTDKSVTVKQKADDKSRIIKISHRKKSIKVTSTSTRDSALHEYSLMAALPATFHAKQPIINDQDLKTAVISRYFTGQELFDILLKNNVPDFSMLQRIDLCLKIAEDLQTLHAADVIHRDLKPENIVANLNANNDFVEVHIIDLGLGISAADASIGGGNSPGTYHYAPPETFAGRKPTFATDNFSLGRVFMVILSGISIDTLFTETAARSATLPAFSRLFPSRNIGSTQPYYIRSLYNLLAEINAWDKENRTSLPAIIYKLKQILEDAKFYFATNSANNSANTATATAAASTTGLFATTQAATKSAGSDIFYTPMPVV